MQPKQRCLAVVVTNVVVSIFVWKVVNKCFLVWGEVILLYVVVLIHICFFGVIRTTFVIKCFKICHIKIHVLLVEKLRCLQIQQMLHVFLIPLETLNNFFLDVQIMFYGKLVCQERSLCHTLLLYRLDFSTFVLAFSRYDLIS